MIVYKTDGTKDGLLSCLFESFLQKETPIAVYSNDFQPSFDTTVKTVITDEEKALRVRNGLIKCGGISLLSELFLPLRSADETKETVIFSVAARCLREKRNVLDDYADPDVLRHYDLAKQIRNEIHRAHGFIRFTQVIGGLYAHFEPDNDVIDLIAPHFAKRFSGEKFIIHDTKRNILVVYDGKSLKRVKNDRPVAVYISPEEEEFKNLWKTYFKSVAIESRKNPKLQDNYLPRRYRKNMEEFL